MTDPDTKRGLYAKFNVERLSDPKGKHLSCDYFVLDMDHDKHALAAIAAYADSCALDYPDLARDLRRKYLSPSPTPETP